MKHNSSCLIIAEDSPESYSPAGERLRHMALASNSFFSKTIVLTWGRATQKNKKNNDTAALLYTTGLAWTTPFPISSLIDPIKFLAFLIRGLVLIVRYQPSCIVVSMPPFETGASGWFLTRLLRKKLIVDYMDDWEASIASTLTRYLPQKLMMPTFKFASMIYSSSSLIFVPTLTLKKTIQKHRINVATILVPNGANTSVFSVRDKRVRREIRSKFDLPLNRIAVIYCGSGINPYYRLDLIMLAAKSLPRVTKEKIFFVFYLYSGIGNCKQIKDELKVTDDLVEIREPLPRSILSEVMAACDVGIVPFDDTPFLLYAMSTKVYEYLSAGVYVVGSGPEGGELNKFFSQNTNCGIFVQPEVKDFVDAFAKIAEQCDCFLEDDARKSRHSFIDENYDSKTIMLKAMACLQKQEGNRDD